METQIRWIPVKAFGHISAYRSYLVSVKHPESIYAMAGYITTGGTWMDGSGNEIIGEVYAIAELPDPMPIV